MTRTEASSSPSAGRIALTATSSPTADEPRTIRIDRSGYSLEPGEDGTIRIDLDSDE